MFFLISFCLNSPPQYELRHGWLKPSGTENSPSYFVIANVYVFMHVSRIVNKMEGIYKSPVIKEEKLEVKRGLLEMPKDSKLSWRKNWKPRYFVFCEVKKGESRKLPLYFYKSRSAYMADELPEGGFSHLFFSCGPDISA